MSLDEYRELWQEQELTEEIGPVDEEVLSQMKERSQEYDRKIFWRDVREIGASVAVAGFFGWQAVVAQEPLARIGAAIVVAGALFIIWKLRRSRRDGEDELAGRPVAERLRAQIEKVDTQIELLEGVLWWYLAPLGTGLALMIVAGTGWSLLTAAELTALVLLYGGIWYLNQRAVRGSHRPYREELARMLRRFEESGGPAGRADGPAGRAG